MSDVIERPDAALVVLPKTALPTIIAGDKDDLLGKLAAKIKAFRADPSTEKGRDAIRSMAAEVSRTKTGLERVADGLTEEWRKSHAAVVAEKKVIKERLDGLRDQVRAPLTAFENMERERVAGHERAILEIQQAGKFDVPPTVAEAEARMDAFLARPVRDWQEFAQRAEEAAGDTADRLAGALALAQQREVLAAEQARRLAAEEAERKAEAARKQAERDAAIAAQAAEQERLRAEQAAALKRQQAAAREQAAANALREAEERAAQAERDRSAEAAAAEQRRVLEAEAAERRQAEAIAAERQRAREAEVAAQQARDADLAAATRQAANKAHRQKINVTALTDLKDAGIAEDVGRAVIIAIAAGKVRHISINY